MADRFTQRLALAALGAAVISCGGSGEPDCLHKPCPMPIALFITVTDAVTGVAVTGAVVRTSQGGVVHTMPCGFPCYEPGYAGTYVLDVEAPGYQSAHRTVKVEGTTPECDCPTVVAEHLTVALNPDP
jgi:hypothetical protein